ncbi:hypothetical protein [Paenibacillus sp. MMO-58]|uniref:hypothetical protein n=1 Tax=Paenibacillus sp. MMO-58 TaxID=3081290 RepID=UPI00301AC540
MKSVMALIILSSFFLYFMFQPSIDRTVQYRDQVLQKKAYEVAHLAALEGRLTPAMTDRLKEDLADLYFDPGKVQLTGPTTAVPRGELITVTLRYPQGKTQIMNLFGGDDEERDYYYPATLMSEYIEAQP